MHDIDHKKSAQLLVQIGRLSKLMPLPSQETFGFSFGVLVSSAFRKS